MKMYGFHCTGMGTGIAFSCHERRNELFPGKRELAGNLKSAAIRKQGIEGL